MPVTTVTAPDRGESLTDTMRRVGVPGSPGMPGAVGSDVRRKPPTKH